MKKKFLMLTIFLLMNIIVFYCVPLMISDTGSGILALIFIIPVSCLLLSILYGSLNSFHLAYPILSAIAFIPAIWKFFNESAWVYCFFYGGIALIGNLLGAGIYKFRKNKGSDTVKYK